MTKFFQVFVICCLLCSCDKISSPKEKRSVLVSVGPYKALVDSITMGAIETQVFVPPGANAHSFEPTPRHTMTIMNSDIWFRVGETFEIRSLHALLEHNPRVLDVDLRQGLEMLPLDCEGGGCHCCHHHHHEDYDIHIWLSVRLMKQQAVTIAKALKETYPALAATFDQGLHQTLDKLDRLDKRIETLFAASSNKEIVVSHAAFGYLCHDYGLRQVPIEYNGQDPTPQTLTKVLEEIKQAGTRRIFIQPEHSSKGARIIADKLNLEIVELNPYSEDFFQNFEEMAIKLSGQQA